MRQNTQREREGDSQMIVHVETEKSENNKEVFIMKTAFQYFHMKQSRRAEADKYFGGSSKVKENSS